MKEELSQDAVKESLIDALHDAWHKYVSAFGQGPHGTRIQISALVELMERGSIPQLDVPFSAPDRLVKIVEQLAIAARKTEPQDRLLGELLTLSSELRGERPPIDDRERATRLTNVALMEAERLYGKKFAFSYTIAYKLNGATLVDTGSNVSVKDTKTLFRYGIEASGESVEVNNSLAEGLRVMLLDAEGNPRG